MIIYPDIKMTIKNCLGEHDVYMMYIMYDMYIYILYMWFILMFDQELCIA